MNCICFLNSHSLMKHHNLASRFNYSFERILILITSNSDLWFSFNIVHGLSVAYWQCWPLYPVLVFMMLGGGLVAKSYPTLATPWTVCNLPGSSVHGILQARILEWVAISFSRGSFPPRNQTQISCIAGRFFTFFSPLWLLNFLWDFSSLCSCSLGIKMIYIWVSSFCNLLGKSDLSLWL